MDNGSTVAAITKIYNEVLGCYHKELNKGGSTIAGVYTLGAWVGNHTHLKREPITVEDNRVPIWLMEAVVKNLVKTKEGQ